MTRGEMYELACILCERHSATISSSYRSVARNEATKGAVADSWHLQGMAFDIEPDNRDSVQMIASDARRFGVRALVYPHHVHIQPD